MITTKELSEVREGLTEIVTQGANLALRLQRGEHYTVGEKNAEIGDRKEIVTSADLQVQEFMLERFSELFRGVAVIAEEGADSSINHSTFFTLDPIDGTLAYSMGSDDWGTMAGFVDCRKALCSAISMPARGFSAAVAKGNGCLINGQIFTSLSHKDKRFAYALGPWCEQWELDKLIPAFKLCGYQIIDTRSTVGLIARMLMGEASSSLGLANRIWDTAPLVALINEVGGVCTDPKGSPITWDSIRVPVLAGLSEECLAGILPLIKEFV